MLWSGSQETIPVGWFFCDGSNGTPDLRDKFIKANSVTDSPGDEGGTSNHDHGFLADGHDHDIAAGTDIKDGTQLDNTFVSSAISGDTQKTNTKPPFYSLCFVQYLGDT